MKLLLFLSFIQQIKSHGTPSFFDSSQQSYKLSQIDPRINADTTIESHNNSTYRGDYDFFYCTATVNNSEFTQCFAFGSNIAGPNGGAMYFFGSAVNIQSSHFEQNEAADGGALCFIQSNVYLGGNTANKFNSNKAYCAGGAILFEGNYYKTNPENYINKLYIFNYNFTNNQAYQTGGALQIELQSNAYLQGVTMESNKAADNGGAIYAKDTDLSIFQSYILKNQAGAKLTVGADTKFNTSSLNFNETYSLHFAGRGCGGIAFLSSLTNTETCALTTQKTCFALNKMIDGITKPLESTSEKSIGGNDIMLENSVSWNSIRDYFQNAENAWVYIGKKENMKVQNYLTNSTDTLINKCYINDSTSLPNNSTVNPYFASPSNPTGYPETTDLPSPSNYTYVATPITRLPSKTTSSPITYPTTKQYLWSSTPNTYTPESIPFKTPHSTAHITPLYTPSLTLPADLIKHHVDPTLSWSVIRDNPNLTVTSIIYNFSTLVATDTTSYVYVNNEYSPTIIHSYLVPSLTSTLTETNIYAPNVKTQESSTLVESLTNISTETYVESKFQSVTVTSSSTTKEEKSSVTWVETLTWFSTTIFTNTYTIASTLVETLIIVPVEDQTLKDNKSPTTIIIWSVIGCIAVFCLAVIALFLYRKTHSESSTSGSESLDDDDVFGDETKFSSQIIEFTQEDDSNMLSTFNGEPEIQEAPDEDEVFLNGEF